MIPKKIHYCWFGYGPKPAVFSKCIDSWKKYCPNYEIIEWNEENFDVNFCRYSKRAYKHQKYAFLTDVARLKIIYECGGVYLDTDVELRNPIDELMENEAWFGYGTNTAINTGTGFGAIPNHPFVKELLNQYISFSRFKKYELCTVLDTKIFKKVFPDFAANHNVRQSFNGVLILENIWHYTIHHYTHTWLTKPARILSHIKNKLMNFFRTQNQD